MKSRLVILFLVIQGIAFGQQKSVAERLGYAAGTRLLIIHADDLGVAHTVNTATIAAMEKGSVNSASIMVPCPWFPEIAAYAKTHPDADLGLHLTLTSEWKLYKWGPVTTKSQVKGLLNPEGYFYDDVAPLVQNATVAEVEQELRAQIEKAKQAGINPTHFDTHMGSVASKPEFAKIYLSLGREYKVPVLMPRDFVTGLGLSDFVTDQDVILDNLLGASPEDFKKGMAAYYTEALKTLKPGLSMMILHAGYDNDELRAVMVDHPDWGSAWRQADFDFFTSAACKKLLKDQKIQLITWKEIKTKLFK